MISQIKKDTVYKDTNQGRNNHDEMDVLESDLLNDFLFKTNDGKANAGDDSDLSKHNNNDEDAIFNAFINTDSLDASSETNNGLSLQTRYEDDTDFQEPSFLMSSSHFDHRIGTDDAVVSDGNSQSPPIISDSSSYHKQCQETIEKCLIFGRTEPLQTPYVNPLDYVDVDESTLPYQLSISGLPKVSRVENQIKLDLKINPPMKQCMVHLPSDCIARQKFYLDKDITNYPQDFQDQLIYVEAFLLCASNNKTTYVCARCVKREHRRASRRKSGLSDNVLWCNNNNRRAIIFNNKQVSVIKDCDENDHCKEFDLTARIVCYCRHHKSPEGFKILFVLKDAKGQILAKNVSSSIVIMDKKPVSNSAGSPIISQSASNTDSGVETNTEVFSTANSSEIPTASSLSDTNNRDLAFAPGKYFAMTDITPLKMEADPNVQLTIPNAPMLSPTSMSEEGSESHASMAERRRDSQPIGSGSTPAALARNESYQRKRPRNEAVTDSNLVTRRTWSNSSLNNSANSSKSQIIPQPPAHLLRSIPDFLSLPNATQPSIQRVIPAQGPINGGIEITLLGNKFKEGLLVKFGDNIALSTQCWSETTMVTYLPPASCAGQVFVTVIDSIENNVIEVHPSNKAIFTYVDDTDRQLIELALQIVGLKMNGKLEDARNIAKRIVGNDDGSSSLSPSNISPGSSAGSMQRSTDMSSMYSDEVLLVKVIKSLHVNSNLSMCDSLGRTLLHLASLKGYYSLCSILIKNGARVNDTDLYGFTPLHFACIGGDARVIRLLVECKADASIKACNSVRARELFITNHGIKNGINHYVKEVLELFDDHNTYDGLSSFSRKLSDSSFHSSVFENDSQCSLDNTHASLQISRSLRDDDRSEYGESDFEEDGDESLLIGDDPGEAQDFEAQSDKTDDQTKQIGTNSMDSSLLNRMLHYLNEDLPKYEDLFPGPNGAEKNKVHPVASESPEEDAQRTSSAVEESQTSSEDEEDAVQLRFNRFFQQRQNFKNDKMLLFFWLPLTVVLLTWYIFFKFGQEDDIVHYFTRFVSEYLRLVLAKILLGNERMRTAFKEQLTIFQSTGILNDFIVA